MKISHYDTLQVSSKAQPEVIEGAYQKLKPVLAEKAAEGDQEARNQLLFLEEAFAVLSSPEKRSAYDASLLASTPAVTTVPASAYTYQSDNTFLSWWGDSKTTRLILAAGVCAALFSAYKFMGQNNEQKILKQQTETQASRDLGHVKTDAYRAESERMLVQGAVQNQRGAIDIHASEVENRAAASAKALELQQQRLDAQIQAQRWAQEQHEKEVQRREAQIAAEAPKKQLCNMYALNGNTRDARAAGCY